MSGLKEKKKALQWQGGAETGSRLGKGSKQLNSEKNTAIKIKQDKYSNFKYFSCCWVITSQKI